MKNCPICKGELKFNEATMVGFSWSNPYVSCASCNFNYTESVRDHKMSETNGINGFDVERMMKDRAESRLFHLFDINVQNVMKVSHRVFS